MCAKKVFSSYEDVAGAWARGVEGRLGGKVSRMYTDGLTIWSYGSHFPIAHKIDGSQQRVWWNSDSYSVSTSHHQRVVAKVAWGCRVPVPTSVLRLIVEEKPDMSPLLAYIDKDEPRDDKAAVDTMRALLREARMPKRLAEFEAMLKELEMKRTLIKLSE